MKDASPDSTSSTLSCITVKTRLDITVCSPTGASPLYSTPPISHNDSGSYNATKVEGSGESQRPEQEQGQNAQRDTLVNGSADTKDKMLNASAGKLGSEWVDGTSTSRLDNVAGGVSKRQKYPFVDSLGEVTNGKNGLRVFRKGTRNQEEPPAKRVRLSSIQGLHEAGKVQHTTQLEKMWPSQGLYAGQPYTETKNQKMRDSGAVKESNILPLPMFDGGELLSLPYRKGRNFELPFDVFSPLPREVMPKDWENMSMNLFVGESATILKQSEPKEESYCLCTSEEGCGESCQNRIMYYECDNSNCRIGPKRCTNRAFAKLRRRSNGNQYDYDVGVMETEDRGYGVRALRTFHPNEMIVEYVGEIITQEECTRRMENEYKDNNCYYFMELRNKLIIDATRRGSIARFVNHSCEPNCSMVEWNVAGEPRMALYAGDGGIMTGEELYFNYNFRPFSSETVQECRCGAPSCSGSFGPKSYRSKAKKRPDRSGRVSNRRPSPLFPGSIPYSVHPGLGPKWDQPVIYPPIGHRRTLVDFDDLLRLDDGKFLNDNLINFYMNWAYNCANLPPNKVYFFNTYFYSSLLKPGGDQRGINYSAVQRWTAKEDIFNYNYVVVPINEYNHWYVVIICNLVNIGRILHKEPSSGPAAKSSPNQHGVGGKFHGMDLVKRGFPQEELASPSPKSTLGRKKKPRRNSVPGLKKYDPDKPIIIALDSLGATRNRTVRHPKDYVLEEGRAKRHINAVIDKSMSPKEIPLQNNFYDCGLFLLGYLDKFFANPREFITKILTREMNVEIDWPDLDPKHMRSHIRDLLFELAKEQRAERRRLELEKRERRKKKVSSSKGFM